MTTSPSKIPAPADLPRHTARSLLREIDRRRGRIYRMRELCAFVLTDDPELARFLLNLGGRCYLPRWAQPEHSSPLGAFRRAPGARPEWDIYIHTIPVRGDLSIWEAVGKKDWPTVDELEFS